MAKIISLKMPDKPDYTNSNAFHSISPFSILNKAIKAIMVERINYLVEKYDFLSFNYYKELKQKCTIDAFLLYKKRYIMPGKTKKCLFW